MYVTNAEIDEMDRPKVIEQEELLDELTLHVRKCWEAAKDHRAQEVDQRLAQCLRQRLGKHDDDFVTARQAEGHPPSRLVYMMLTDEKCSALESWLEDILMPPDDKPWAVEPTPIPEIKPFLKEEAHQMVVREVQKMLQSGKEAYPEIEEDAQRLEMEAMDKLQMEMQKMARLAAEKVEEELYDVLMEAKWGKFFKDFLANFSTYPVAYIKGVVLRNKKVLKWGEDGPVVADGIVREYDVPSPFNLYPSPNSTDIDDGYLIERHTLTRGDLFALVGVDGYDEDEIREVLDEGKDDSASSWLWDEQREAQELQGVGRPEDTPEPKIDALQFWGSVPGRVLKAWKGWKEHDIIYDEDKEYDVEVWLIDKHVIRAVVNADLLGRKPYYKASFRELPGQFFGLGLPEVIRDAQLICNSTIINLLDNLSIASGPQVGVDVGSMPAGEDFSKLYPWKIWPFDMQGGPNVGTPRNPLWFFQPEILADKLLPIYEKFAQEADNKSGIPRFSYGQKETGGPLGTATGFSMMMTNASRGIKKVVRNIDYGVLAPLVKRLYLWLMIYDDEFRAGHTGDIKIVARGSGALVAKEQTQIRLVEVLQMLVGNEHLMQLAGLSGMADVFRRVLQGVNVDVHNIIPSALEIEVMEKVAEAQAQAQAEAEKAQMEGQANQANAQARQVNQAGDPVSGQDHAVGAR